MEERAGNRLISIVEDYALVRQFVLELCFYIKNGGVKPMVPCLNEEDIQDWLSSVAEHVER